MDFHVAAGYLGIKYTSMIIGFIGGVLSLAFIKTDDSWYTRTTYAFGGGLSANYFEPPISGYFVIEQTGYVAFIIGLFGMSIIATLMQVLQRTRWARILDNWLERKFGGR